MGRGPHIRRIVAVETEAEAPVLWKNVEAHAAPPARRQALVGVRGTTHVRTKPHREHENSQTARGNRHE